MKIAIPLTHDSENSHPNAHLEVEDRGGDWATIRISDNSREMSVDREELVRLLAALDR